MAPEKFKLENTIEKVIRMYPSSVKPLWSLSNVIDEELLRAEILEHMLHDVPKDSTPGVPLCNLGKKNSEIIDKFRDFVVDCVFERMRCLCETDVEDFKMLSSIDLVQLGFCDPVRLFVKNEPHNREKLAQKRYRLISSVSLIDNLVQRCIFTNQDQTEIEIWQQIPSKPGIGFSDPQILELINSLGKKLDNAGDADISGWDWSVKDWEMLVESEMRCRLSSANTLFRRAIYNTIGCLSFSVFCFSDGFLAWQLERGIVKSGSKITSSSNSRIRVFISILLGAAWCIAMGDDSTEEFMENAKEKYLGLGHIVKAFDRVKDRVFNFCSATFKNGVAYPSDPSKSLYRFLNQAIFTKGLLEQFVYENRHSPHLTELLEVISASGVRCEN